MKLFEELKRRNVFRVGIAYLAIAWVLLQITDVIAPILVLPDWLARAVLFLLAIGFPIVLLLAWAYELTPDGIKAEKDIDRSEPGSTVTGPWVSRLIIVFLAIAVVLLLAERFTGGASEEAPVAGSEPAGVPLATGSAETGDESKTIVVLPLDNLMNDPEQAYFVEGMHEALITELSKIEALNVISRTSALKYRESTKSLPEIARELGVDMVVEGSVLRAGNTVRITAQLIDGSNDRHLWADNFDRELVDILTLYSEVTREIVEQIQVKITPQDEARLASAHPLNAEAYEQYLQGWYKCDTWNSVDMIRGIALMKESIELDPGSALAHAGLALCLQYAAFFDYLQPLKIVEQARAAAQRAVELDGGLAEARVALAGVQYYLEFDLQQAESELRRALELNPGNHQALIHTSWMLGEAGRVEDAVAYTERAIELDPYAAVAHNALGQIYYLARDYDRSIAAYEKALELDPNDPSAYYYLALPREQKGNFDKSIELHRKAVDLSAGAPLFQSGLAYSYAIAGQTEEARKILAELMIQFESGAVAPIHLAMVHLGLGELDSAIDLLEQAFKARNSHMLYINRGPKFDPLRGNDRFKALIKKMGW